MILMSYHYFKTENGRNKEKRSKGNNHRDDKDKLTEFANVPGNQKYITYL